MQESELSRAAASLADGRALDWGHLAGGRLSAQELDALRLLEEVRLSGAAPQPIEDGFELRGELGRGSTGRVYRALDRSLRREVALKIVAAEGAAATRFVEEARLLASLRHPGIVQVHSIHEHDGEIRMALELVEGRTLEEIVRSDGPLDPGEAVRVVLELCTALALLHERGITHRDLKPANAMREEGGRVVLLDFGIARSPSAAVPLSGSSAGTPRFMSPEQFAGADVGPRSDLWSLGALLYWLVSASFPFEGRTYEELARAVRSGAYVPLPQRRADLDPRLAALVARALERDPSRRFQTAAELERELRALAPSASALAGHPRGRRRSRTAAAVLALACALGAGAWLATRGEGAGLQLRAELFARRGGADVRLRAGDAIAEGDLLVLEASCDDPFHLYVLNEDGAGEMHVLFPVPGFEPRNPLAAEMAHRLPGTFRGEPQCWVVTSSGGGEENVLIVAAREPVPALDRLLADVPAVQPGEGPAYPAVPREARAEVLRGIGGTAAEPRSSARVASRGAHELEQLAASLAQPDPVVAVRLVRLVHQD